MCSPVMSLLPAAKEIFMDDMIRVSLHEADPGKGGSVPIEINNQATVQNLISSYCAKKGIGYSPKIVIFDGKKNTLAQFRTLQSLGIGNGQTLYVGYKKKSSTMDRKWIFILTTITIAAFVLATIVMASLYATTGGVIPFDFGIVMDAGSSKTNVILYKWAGDKYKGTGCVRQEYACKADGGIAKADNVSYVVPCLEKTKEKIKPSSLSSTPLYFAATAGMRLLNISDPAKANGKLDALDTVLNNTGVSLQTVEIISGKDEGQYAWITANFMKDTLEIPQILKPWKPTTVGAMDMGGASNQIAFALEPKNETDSGIEKVQLYGQTHDVFSASYLCFGRDEAEMRHRSLLVTNPDVQIIDPCTPKNYVYNVTRGQLFDQPCTKSDRSKIDPASKNKNVTFVGSGDFTECSRAMIHLVDTTFCRQKNFKECFQKINKPLEGQKFLAFATYYYTTSALSYNNKTLDQGTYDDYIAGTKEYCARTINDVDLKNKHATAYCFNACYMYEILVNGFGFSNSTWHNIEFLGKIDDKDIGWSLGYMIKATNIIPAKNPSPRITSVGIFAVCMVIFIFVIIIATAFLAYNFGRKKSSASTQNMFRNP